MIKFIAGQHIILSVTPMSCLHLLQQSAQCNKQANVAHKVKISLLMMYVPRKGSLTQVGKTCSGSKQNMESSCLGKKNRKYLSLAESYSTATRSTRSGALTHHYAAEVHVQQTCMLCDALCPASLYHLSNAHSQDTQNQRHPHMIRLLLFIWQKSAAELFYSVEKFRQYKMNNGIKVFLKKDMQLIGTCIKLFIHLNLVSRGSLKDIQCFYLSCTITVPPRDKLYWQNIKC